MVPVEVSVITVEQLCTHHPSMAILLMERVEELVTIIKDLYVSIPFLATLVIWLLS